jgi:predicted metal-dependent peptidase
MRIILIDTSGGITAAEIDTIRRDIKVGDHVAMFDTSIYPLGVVRSQQQIDTFELCGRGGTMIQPALDYARKIDPTAEVICFSDGYFCEGTPEQIFPKCSLNVRFVQLEGPTYVG